MKHKAASVWLLGLLFFCPRAHAQEFTLDNSSASDDQVLDVGSAVFAFDVSGTAATVNGVDFSAGAINTGALGISTFRTPSSEDKNDSAMSSGLFSVLSSSLTDTRAAGGLAITGLTSGQTYELQVFTQGAGTAGSETVTDLGSNATGDLLFGGDGSGADSIIATFVAGSTGEEDFGVTADNGGSLVTFSAVNLRQADAQPDAADAPEPGTVPLCLTGALLLGLMERRRRAVA